MRAVTNAGAFIALGKPGFVHLLSQLYDPILVPTQVYQEVVTRGLELGQPDAYTPSHFHSIRSAARRFMTTRVPALLHRPNPLSPDLQGDFIVWRPLRRATEVAATTAKSACAD